MVKAWAKQKGFTIVELLIVIVVIAILAAITIVAFNGVNDRARSSKITSDIATLIKVINLARQTAGANLNIVTGNNATGGNCWGKPNGTDLAALPASDACIATYDATLNALSTVSGANVRGMRDPWGRPYLIDENEGEGAGNCTRDSVAVYKLPFTTGFGSYSSTPVNNIPNGGFTGCT